MIRLLIRLLPLSLLGWAVHAEAALDSYRYMHVTIDTPWSIFLFLLIGILSPFVLMGVLIWRHALRKRPTPEQPSSSDDPKS